MLVCQNQKLITSNSTQISSSFRKNSSLLKEKLNNIDKQSIINLLLINCYSSKRRTNKIEIIKMIYKKKT